MTIFKLQDLTVNRGNNFVLKSGDISLNQGEILAVIGANGSGKSTLVNTLSDADKVVSGNAVFNDLDLLAIPIKQRAQFMGVLTQQNQLNFPFFVEDVVLLGRTPHRTGSDYDNQCVKQVSDALDITHLKRRIYTELSGGEKQRVQLARVLVQVWELDTTARSPRLLILDEPCNALDLAHKQQLIELIKTIVDRGVTVIWVEHDLNLVSMFANKILALHQGEVAAFGDVESQLDEHLIESLFSAKVRFITDSQTGRKVIAL